MKSTMKPAKRRRLLASENTLLYNGPPELQEDFKDTPDPNNDPNFEFKECPFCLQFHRKDIFHQCRRMSETKNTFFCMYRCNRCQKIFTPISNVGMWKCLYHPGEYDRDKGYSCCGAKRLYCNNPYVHNMVWSRKNIREPNLRENYGNVWTKRR